MRIESKENFRKTFIKFYEIVNWSHRQRRGHKQEFTSHLLYGCGRLAEV